MEESGGKINLAQFMLISQYMYVYVCYMQISIYESKTIFDYKPNSRILKNRKNNIRILR